MIDVTYFRASGKIPPGVALVMHGDVVQFFGPFGALAVEMQKGLPSGSLIHVSIKDYTTISSRMQQIAPEAPSIEKQNQEFEGWHSHPHQKWNFRVSMDDGNPDQWKWRRAATILEACLPIDTTLYPTAEAAYLAAIGE